MMPADHGASLDDATIARPPSAIEAQTSPLRAQPGHWLITVREHSGRATTFVRDALGIDGSVAASLASMLNQPIIVLDRANHAEVIHPGAVSALSAVWVARPGGVQ